MTRLSLTRLFASLLFAAVLWTPASRAQAGPVDGEHDLQIWTGGGHGLNGSTGEQRRLERRSTLWLDFDRTGGPGLFARASSNTRWM